MPFTVKEEKGNAGIDHRGKKCVQQSLASATAKKCLLLLATDMKNIRNELSDKLLTAVPPTMSCDTYQVTQHRITNNSIWGPVTRDDYEKRRPHDEPRSVLEAYLDWFLLSEYSDYMVIATGSTFSQVIVIRSMSKPTVTRFFEFPQASCKKGYFPYECCQERRAWNDVFVRQHRIPFRACEDA